jgi:hypothetical protein
MRTARRSGGLLTAAVLLTATLGAARAAAAQDGGTVFWTGTMHRWERQAATSQRGVFGLALSSPHSYTTTSLSLTLEERRDTPASYPRLVLVEGYWKCSVGDLYYVDPDGNRHPAGRGGSASGSLSAAAFSGSVTYDEDRQTHEPMVELTVGIDGTKLKVPVETIPLEITTIRGANRPQTVLGHSAKKHDEPVHVGGFTGRALLGLGAVTMRKAAVWPNGEETWVFTRHGAEDLELIVEPDPYDTWRPEGDKDEQKPGDFLAVQARLQERGGGPPRQKADRIRFALSDVSRQPGVALNWPPKGSGSASRPDLRFDQDRNSDLWVTDDVYGRRVQTPEGEKYAEATAVVSSYDWGGWATLRVTADVGGRRIVGHLKGQPERTSIPLPKRDQSRIADVWRQQAAVAGVSDSDDGETQPDGDGDAGDGLSLYEEYRGFYEHGRHIEGDPKHKDYFLQVAKDLDNSRTRQGILLFSSISELAVHYRLEPNEISGDRVINFNGQAAHLVDQHGVLMVKGDTGGKYVRGRTAGGPGTPAMVTRIVIRPEIVPGIFGSAAARQSYAGTVAHELCHSVNVYHHGDDDLGMVEWKKGTDPQGHSRVYETALDDDGNPWGSGVPVEVYSEDGQLLSPDAFAPGYKVWVAVKGGQHSGVQECVMRYQTADAVDWGVLPPKRYWLGTRDARDESLCDSPVGTGVNAWDHSPRPRYGDASPGRGGCKHQIRVNDLGKAPTR